jgi:hypothetical protein
MTENLKQKLKHCSVGLLFASMALTGTTTIFAKSPADPNKVLHYTFPQLKQVSTQRISMTYIRHM